MTARSRQLIEHGALHSGCHQNDQQDPEPARPAAIGDRSARLIGAMGPALEVADVFRRHGEAFRQVHAGHLGGVERRVMTRPDKAGDRRRGALASVTAKLGSTPNSLRSPTIHGPG